MRRCLYVSFFYYLHFIYFFTPLKKRGVFIKPFDLNIDNPLNNDKDAVFRPELLADTLARFPPTEMPTDFKLKFNFKPGAIFFDFLNLIPIFAPLYLFLSTG